ncbi:dnaJ homolog subfamily C member 7 [Diachasma alloeum]|uniref:dnaJ homolog subfamily C member 7 n=1 Tax=Diachasma alloeum TaxID=454923 RepID=UPI00073831D9|nr:dnaJ homolog subfamily C member 7 [Diachasma alloeum]
MLQTSTIAVHCYMMIAQYDKAILDANTVIELDPSCVKAYVRLIKCAILLGDINSAESHLTKFSQIDSKHKIISSERDRIREFQEHSQREMIAARNNNYENALECVNKCLLISPYNRAYKIKNAEYLALLGRHNQAQEVVNEILKKDAINVDAKYILGLCVYYSDTDEAVHHFEDVLQLDPDHMKCLQVYKKAKKIVDMRKKGNNEFIAGNFSVAHDLYSSALTIDPGNTAIKKKLLFNMGQASYRLKEFERVIAEYSQALAIDPNLIKALKQRGKSYMEIKNCEEAIADFSRVYGLDPTDECLKLIHDAEKILSSVKQDHYEILGVSRDLSIDQLKQAYKYKALLHHPDRHSNATPEEKKKHERKFKDITRSYRDLMEECKRKLSFAD